MSSLEAEVTSWLSNLIKWNYINLESENRRIIDSDRSKKNPVFEQIAATAEQPDRKREKKGPSADGFQEGMKTVNYDEILKKEREQIEIEKNAVLSEARKQADEIILQARQAAENIKNDAYTSGHESGREAGKAEALEILEREKEKLREYQEQLDAGYQERLTAMEPMIADFMARLIEKLIGVVAEDKEEIILYLVRCGLEQTGKSKHFTVRVSPEDYPVAEAQKERLMLLMDGQGELAFREDKGLTKNQCVIETDTAIIESSLDIQLKNLTEDIRLMAIDIDR